LFPGHIHEVHGDEALADAARRQWTLDAFFGWQASQTERYELVDGLPRLMAGASNLHDDIVVNILADLRNQTRGTPCRPFTGDGAVETRAGQIRRPDIGLDCGRRDPRAMIAAEPRVIIEVLSPSTRDFDTFEKLAEYRSVATVTHVILVESVVPRLVIHSRQADGTWASETIDGGDARATLVDPAITLSLASIYEGVAFPPEPRLVVDNR
jgi:Uma2 family endonuclease